MPFTLNGCLGQQLQSDDLRYYHVHGQHLHEQRVNKFSPFTVRNNEGGNEARRLCELGELDTSCIMVVRVHGPQGWASELLSATCMLRRSPSTWREATRGRWSEAITAEGLIYRS